MSHTSPQRVQVEVKVRPPHVGGNHHHELHLESLVGIKMEAILHHDHQPDGTKMVLVPAMRAINEMLNANRLFGATYWRSVWHSQMPNGNSDWRHSQVPNGDNDHYNFFAIPASCCEVTEPMPL